MKTILIIDDDVITSSIFNLYDKLHKISKKVEDTPKEFRVCFMTSSVINYQALADIHPELGQECYVSKEVPKEVFIKHINSLIPWLYSI